LLRVERALLASEALADDARVLVDQDGHGDQFLAAAATTFFAASVRSVAAMRSSPLSASSLRPCGALVPSMRTTTGRCRPRSRAAPMTPSAIMSQRTMPPKMLTRIAFTFGLVRISLNA